MEDHMFKFPSFRAALVAALFTPVAGFAGQFVVELEAPF
jgi:hypothetical protein